MKPKKKDPREAQRPKRPDRLTIVDTLQGQVAKVSTADLYYNSWVSKSTIRNHQLGKVRKPQIGTMVTLANALGCEYKLVRKPR